jgi:uncharacterized membrane protein
LEWLVIIALCVALLFAVTVPVGRWSAAVIRRLDPSRRTAPKILDERYARGGIGPRGVPSNAPRLR